MSQIPPSPASKSSSNFARVGLFFSPPRSSWWWTGCSRVEIRGSVIDHGRASPVQEERNGNLTLQSFHKMFVLHTPSRSSPRLHLLQLPPFPLTNPPPMSLTSPHPDSSSTTLPYNYSPRSPPFLIPWFLTCLDSQRQAYPVRSTNWFRRVFSRKTRPRSLNSGDPMVLGTSIAVDGNSSDQQPPLSTRQLK